MALSFWRKVVEGMSEMPKNMVGGDLPDEEEVTIGVTDPAPSRKIGFEPGVMIEIGGLRGMEARIRARSKLDNGGMLDREEYADAMVEAIRELEKLRNVVLSGILEEKAELRAQVEELKGALERARGKLEEQDKVIGALVRSGVCSSSMS